MSRGKAITQEERARILGLRAQGATLEQISELSGRSISSVQRVLKEEQRKFEDGTAPKDPSAPPRDCIAGFTLMYQRIVELNRKKQEINKELHNIMATLRNALEIAESGDVP